jgi:hypothetical protein
MLEKVVFVGNKFGDKQSYFAKVRYEYKSFDLNGNWTKAARYFWGKGDTVYRKLTYY